MSSLTEAGIGVTAFWDVDPFKFDMDKHDLQIMTKVFNDGTLEDLKALIKFYGYNRIRETIIHAAYIKEKALSLICLLFDLHQTDFKAIQHRKTMTGSIWTVKQ